VVTEQAHEHFRSRWPPLAALICSGGGARIRLMPTARLPLVGRRDEMTALEDELARAAAGEFRVVLLSGEAGVGKSRLGRELLARHPEAAGMFARAHPLGVTAAFGVWTEAIDPLLRGQSDPEVTATCGGLLDDLASLFHRVAVIRGSLPDREPPLPRLLQGLAAMLRNLARQAPVIAVLDDVHFADASSWEALRYFARHLDDIRLLVVATGRSGDLAGQEVAAQALFELDEDGFLRRLEVIPLDRHATRELSETIIGQPPPAALVDWVGQRARGNPLYVISLVRALLEEHADLSAPSLHRLPEGLTERMAARTRGADAISRAVLDMLAVTGRPLPLADLAALTGLSAERLDPILAGLIAGRAVAEGQRAGELIYEIQHPLLRDVIYQQISGARKRSLHRQAARSLLESGRLAEAALHFARSAQPGDEEAVRVLLDAIRQAEQREAFRETLDLLSELVEILPPADPRWLDVLEAMYWQAEWVVDHRAETRAETAIRALRAIDGLLAHSGGDARRATVKFRLANFLAWGTGELPEAEQACCEAVRLFEAAGEQRQALLARREISWIRYLRGDVGGMAGESARVVAAAEALGDRFVAMQGLVTFGYSSILRARFADGESAIRRAVGIAEQDEKAYRLTAALSLLAAAVTLQGRSGESAALFEQARSVNPAFRDTILIELETFVHWMAGDFTSAVATARELTAWVVSGARRRALGLACGGLAAAETGDLREAESLLGRARQGLGGRDWSYFLLYTRYGEAVLTWHAGQPAECAEALADVAGGLIGMDALAVSVFVLTDLAEAAADAKDEQAAAAAARQLDDVAPIAGLGVHRGIAATAAAWASLAGGQPDAAVARATEAVGLLSGAGWRSHLGRAHDVLGRSLAAADRPGAVAALEQAAAIFAGCGAAWRRDRTIQVLRRLGSGGRRAAAATLGPASLTRREREVARLAARGMSAKAIAEALFVGERTVESHLSSTYAKLRVESKLDLVRRAAELGLSLSLVRARVSVPESGPVRRHRGRRLSYVVAIGIHRREDRHERLRSAQAAARGPRGDARPAAHRAAGLAGRAAGRVPDRAAPQAGADRHHAVAVVPRAAGGCRHRPPGHHDPGRAAGTDQDRADGAFRRHRHRSPVVPGPGRASPEDRRDGQLPVRPLHRDHLGRVHRPARRVRVRLGQLDRVLAEPDARRAAGEAG
jgi:DNA-binding CsgD family transcriptional regulator